MVTHLVYACIFTKMSLYLSKMRYEFLSKITKMSFIVKILAPFKAVIYNNIAVYFYWCCAYIACDCFLSFVTNNPKRQKKKNKNPNSIAFFP